MTLTTISPNEIKTGIDEYKRIVLLLNEGSVDVKVILWPWQFEDLVESINNQAKRSAP